MRFQRIHVSAYGGLEDLDTGPEPLTRLVVLHGPNEAGKSTFFHFLTALLYGFYPASRDTNPFAPWNGADAGGRATLLLDDGEVLEVHRRLLSSPSGSLVRGEVEEDLRNRTLPCVQHVPMTVFRQVFALTLGELAGLGGETWGRIQDRLVTGMGASDLNSVRDAIQALEKEAGGLWRPNRMGNQEVRNLSERLAELRKRRPELAEEDRKLREAARDRGRLEERLEEARLERESCRVFIERYRAILPIRDQLRRIEGLEEEAGPPELLHGLPADPEARLRELAAEIESIDRQLEELEDEGREPRRALDDFGATDEDLLEREEAIRTLAARAAGQESVHVRVGQIEQELRDRKRRAEVTATELFRASWEDVDRDAVRRIAVSALRSAVSEHREAREERRVAEEAARTAPTDAGGPAAPGWLGPVLVGVGTVAGGAGLLVPSTALAVVGALLLGMGAALVARAFGEDRSGAKVGPTAAERLEAAREMEERARARVVEELEGLPFREGVLSNPPGDLPTRLEALQDALREMADREERLAGHRAELTGLREDLDRIAGEIGVEPPAGAPAVAADTLSRRLHEAERRRDRAVTARASLERLERGEERLRGRMEELTREKAELAERLEALGDGDLDAGVTEAVRRQQARDRADQLRAELRQSHHDLEEIRDRIREAEAEGEDWAVDDEALARRRARESELSGEIEELGRRLEGVKKDMAYLSDGDTLDALDGEIAALEARRERAVRESDRLRILAAVLREADRRFRDAHQPDILLRAGKHLSAVTDGRYERILVNEARNGTFHLHADHLPAPQEIDEPLSTGTREQVYLALRLAMMDHLDDGGERLPLFMDEAFVNWDRTRRDRAFALLEEVSRTRQVFVFTCHESMAAELADRGARTIVLESPARMAPSA